MTEEDAALLRRKTGCNYKLSYVNKLLIKHSVDSPNNRFRCKEAVLNYMKKTLIHEMRPPSVANNPLFNFKLDNPTRQERLIYTVLLICYNDVLPYYLSCKFWVIAITRTESLSTGKLGLPSLPIVVPIGIPAENAKTLGVNKSAYFVW